MKKKKSNPDACYKYNPPNCSEQARHNDRWAKVFILFSFPFMVG